MKDHFATRAPRVLTETIIAELVEFPSEVLEVAQTLVCKACAWDAGTLQTEICATSLTRFVTYRLTSFGSRDEIAHAVSLNHTSYGYLRGPQALAQALPL